MPSILIADDDSAIFQELRQFLEPLGCRALGPCLNTDTALEKAQSRGPGLVLMNAGLTGSMDALEACRIIQDRLGVPVVLIAQDLDDETLNRAVTFLPYGYVTNPHDGGQVKAAVRMALARKAGERQFYRLLGQCAGEPGEKELLYAVLEGSPFGLAVIGPKGRLVYTNKELTNITGYGTAHTRSAFNFLSLILPDEEERDAFLQSFSQARSKHRVGLHEGVIRCADGSTKTVEARTVFLQDGTAVMTAVDVSERCKAVEALRESEHKFRTVANYTFDWEFWLTPDWRLEYVSPSCEDITGYTAAAFMERPGLILDIVLEDDRAALRAALDQTMHDNVNRRLDFRLRTRDGETRWLALATTPLPGQKGTVAGIRGSIRNITWRKRAEEALRLAEEKYRTIFEEAPLGVFRSTPDGKFTEVNPALAAMLGYDSPQDVLDSVEDIAKDLYVHPERRGEIVETIMSAPGAASFENEYYRADGTTFTAKLHVRVFRDDNGGVLHLEGMVEDITEKKQAEALREDVERMTRHDLKSPLISILYGMRLLSSGENLTDEQRDIVEHAESSGYRMLNMLNLSLGLYKMETGTYKLQPKSVDLMPIVRRIFSELASEMKHRKVTAELTVHGDPDHGNESFTASGEEVLLYSMLSNLIRNAMEASPKGNTVRVDLAGGEEVRVTIHNMGAVPAPIRETFFNKYVTSGKREGTGLGAYGAKLIAVTHGGDVSCDSDEERGTTVTVTLPREVAETR